MTAPRDATGPATQHTESIRTKRVTLTWEDGEGPVIQPRHTGKPVMLTAVWAEVRQAFPDRLVVEVARGVFLKKDGTPGLTDYVNRFSQPSDFPDSVVAELWRALAGVAW